MLAFPVSCILSKVSFAGESSGVLVVSEFSSVRKVSVLDIRRMYLGLPSPTNSLIKNTVINFSDINVYNEFLKNVMHMTDRGYRRKIIKRIFRQGGKKVREIHSIKELVKYLEQNPYDVSFMTKDVAMKTKGIKVVQVIW